MADEEDNNREGLLFQLLAAYRILTLTCEMLPIPISLPTGAFLIGDALDAVRRVMELTQDQPMPEDQQADLFAACVYWHAATDLMGLQMHNPEINRAPMIEANLLGCEGALHELVEWIQKNE